MSDTILEGGNQTLVEWSLHKNLLEPVAQLEPNFDKIVIG
jgi:hypothetical protein